MRRFQGAFALSMPIAFGALYYYSPPSNFYKYQGKKDIDIQKPIDKARDEKAIDITPVKPQKIESVPINEVATKETTPIADQPIVQKIKESSPQKKSNTMYASYVLVGGGTASYAAMKAIQEKEKDADILIITNEDFAPYMRPPLSKELWFSSDPNVSTNLKFKDWGGTLRDMFYEEIPNYKVVSLDGIDSDEYDASGRPRLLLNTEVTDLNVEAKYITLNNGKRVKYNKLLLATGGKPKTLSIVESLEPELQKKFSTFRTVKDFRKLKELAGNGKHIVVVGGGFLGSELAIALSRFGEEHGVHVTQVFPEDGNMGLVFPKYLMEWTKSRINKVGVQTITNSKIAHVDNPNPSPVSTDSPVRLKLTNGKEILADHVVVAIGIEPNVSLAEKAGLEIDEKRGGIIVNAELEARTGVFAAGDTSSYHDVILGRRRVEHHDHAILSGRFAGYNMTGQHKPYKHQSMFWSDLGPEIGYEAVGVLDGNLPTVGLWAKATEKDAPKAAGITNIRSIDAREMKDSTETDQELPKAKWFETSIPINSGEPDTKELDDKYGKGVVFYTNAQQKIVGVLMWNIFNRTAIASRIISEGKTVNDIQELARLFKIHD